MKDRKRNPDSRKNIVFNIQSIILSVLMAISLVTIIVMGLLLYHRFKLALEKTAVDNTEATVEATVDPVKCRSAGYPADYKRGKLQRSPAV